MLFLFRNNDPGYFCRQAEEMYKVDTFDIWIVSDCRRKTDFAYFESNYPSRTKRVRIYASDVSRVSRGFVFTAGIDDAETECGVDDSETEFVLENSDQADPEVVLQPIIEHLKSVTAGFWSSGKEYFWKKM